MLLEGSCHCGAVRFSLQSRTPRPYMVCYCSICRKTGSALWVANPHHAESVYPFASAMDTPLPVPTERDHIMENYRPDWVAVAAAQGDAHFPEYPTVGIHDWHERRGLLEPE